LGFADTQAKIEKPKELFFSQRSERNGRIKGIFENDKKEINIYGKKER
jgi:hypothetical protein